MYDGAQARVRSKVVERLVRLLKPNRSADQPVKRQRPAEMVSVGAGLLGGKKKKTGKAAKNASSLINKWQAVRKVTAPSATPLLAAPSPVTAILVVIDCVPVCI